MPDIRYPGSTGPFPARTPEPKAEPVTIIALCDGSAVGFAGTPNLDTVRAQNALAADRLVERIAKRVTEMQADQASLAQMYVETLVKNVRRWGEIQAIASALRQAEARG